MQTWQRPRVRCQNVPIDRQQSDPLHKHHLRETLQRSLAAVGRGRDYSFYSDQNVTFEIEVFTYYEKVAAGFIKINALRLKLLVARDKRMG